MSVEVKEVIQTEVFRFNLVDDSVPEYVSGSITLDGVKYSIPAGTVRSKTLEHGRHTISVSIPSGWEFSRWHTWDDPDIAVDTPKASSTGFTLTGHADIQAWIHPVPAITTDLSISLTQTPPVAPGSSLTYTGKLKRTDTGAGIGSQSILIEQPPGTLIGATNTMADGSYTFSTNAPTTPGTYKYRAVFKKTSGYGGAVSRTLGVGVGIVANMWTAIKAWWNGLTRWQKALVLGISGGTVVASVVLKKK